MRELRGEQPVVTGTVTLHRRIDIRIPADYIGEESQRLPTYKRIANLDTEEARRKIREEYVATAASRSRSAPTPASIPRSWPPSSPKPPAPGSPPAVS